MMFPQLAQFTDVAFLLLRVMVAIVFITSGWKHFQDPEARSKDIGMSNGFTIFLGAAEGAGGLGVIFGVLAYLARIPDSDPVHVGTVLCREMIVCVSSNPGDNAALLEHSV